jgi:hypothetical protein
MLNDPLLVQLRAELLRERALTESQEPAARSARAGRPASTATYALAPLKSRGPSHCSASLTQKVAPIGSSSSLKS